MELYKLIMPLGILTYSFALITVITGLKKIKIKNHTALGIITIALATIHALLVIFSH